MDTMKKILITGATGFVGKTLIPFLYSAGQKDLCLLVRNTSKAKSLFPEIYNTITIVDCTKDDWRDNVIQYNPDVTIHMATCPNHHNDAESVRQVVETNILFSSLILEAISKTRCKYFINVGTFSEYLYEGDKFFPNNFYSASKTALRPIIKFWQTISGWKWINVIPYSPYGRHNEITKVFDLIYRSLDADRPMSFSEGKQVLDFIHVDDMAAFFLSVLNSLNEFSDGFTQLYLGTGVGHSIRELATIFEKITGKISHAVWGALPYRQLDPMHAIAPIEKNPSFLTWKPKISLESGIKIYIDDING